MDLNTIAYGIRGAVFEVNSVLGSGYLEKVYENALLIELYARGFKAESQVPVKVYYKENVVGEYIVDILVFALSLRLRQREINTIFKLGCNRMTIARLLGAEILIIVLMSGVLCGVMVFLVNQFSNDLVRMLFIR